MVQIHPVTASPLLARSRGRFERRGAAIAVSVGQDAEHVRSYACCVTMCNVCVSVPVSVVVSIGTVSVSVSVSESECVCIYIYIAWTVPNFFGACPPRPAVCVCVCVAMAGA